MSRLAIILLSLSACAPPRVPDEVALRSELTRIRDSARAYLREQTEQQWHAWIATPSPDGGTLEQHRWVVATPTIDTLRRGLRAEASADGRRALHYIHAFLIGEHLRGAVRDIDLRVRARQNQPFDVDGRSLAFLEVSTALAREANPNRRRRIAEAASPVLTEINPLLQKRDRAITEVGARLGYRDRVRLASEVRGYDVRRTGELAKQLLSSSDALYLSALAELAPPALGVPFEHLRRADIPRLVAAPAFADRFPPEQLVTAATATFLELGIDLDRLPLHVDTEPSAGKHPRAACFPVVVPTDIRLSIKRAGGAADYSVFLHEMGHALQFAFTRTPHFEFQQLGDASVAETFAFLFEGLADDPVWLAERLHMSEPDLTRYARRAALRRLLMVRRHAAKLLYELEWRSNSETDPEQVYARQLERAYGFPLEPVDAEHFLVDQDPFMQSADYVRGWLLAAQIETELRQRFGPTWWKSSEAGALLREAWSAGQRDTAEELARRFGVGPIDADPLLAWAANTFIRRASIAGAHRVRGDRAN